MVQASRVPAIVHATSGALGGTLANIAVFPLDLITTRLQVQSEFSESQQYKSIADAFQQILQKEGMAGLYEGMSGDSFATMIQSFLYFFAYDFMRNSRLHQIQNSTGKLPRTLKVGEELLIGSLAGMACKFFTSPIGNIVIMQQTATLGGAQEEPSFWQCAKDIYNDKGITGFWAGYRATLLLSINPSITHYLFQALSERMVPRYRRNRPTLVEVFLAAAVAKSIASLITYPVIMAKTRNQLSASHSKPIHTQLHESFSKHGIAGWYDGVQGQLLKGFFNQGITMLTKDKITQMIVYTYLYFYRVRR